jgi:hypothetical protein
MNDFSIKNEYAAINFAMVEAHWEIGKRIVEMQDGNKTAEYGKKLIKELSRKLTIDYVKGFDETNLRKMRKIYLCFKKRGALRHELTLLYNPV